jgi:hypothetical protein
VKRTGSGMKRPENPLDGRSSKTQPQIRQRAAKAGVAPRRILASDLQQLGDLGFVRMWTARAAPRTTAVVLRGDSLSISPQDRVRRRKRRHLGQQLSSKRLTFVGEQPSLCVCET